MQYKTTTKNTITQQLEGLNWKKGEKKQILGVGKDMKQIELSFSAGKG